MAYDEGLAQILRDYLADYEDITEKKMFGGLAFMHRGNMLCGVHKDGAMARVGKEHERVALEIEGISPLSFTGRPMGGMVDMDEGILADAPRLDKLMSLALAFVSTLPPK